MQQISFPYVRDLAVKFWVFMTALLRWVLLCHSRTDQKQFIYLIIKNCIQGRICIIKPALRYYLITIWWHKRSLFYLIFEKLLGGNAPERIHRAQFPGELTKEDSNSGCGVGGGGNLPREDFPGTNSLNGHPPLNMWKRWLQLLNTQYLTNNACKS